MKLLSDEKKAALQAIPSRTVPAPPSYALPWLPAQAFLQFTYTSQQLHAENGSAWMTAQQLRYEDGRLSAERFEGEVPMAACHQAIGDAQRVYTDQALTLVEQFSALLSMLLLHPGPRERSRD